MQYELSALERSVLEQINQVTTATNKKNEDIQKETERIKDAFLKELFSGKSNEALEKYAVVHQKSLVLLMNDVFNSRPKDYDSDKTGTKAVLTELENLLSFLVIQFHGYISMELAVPKFIKERELIRFHQNMESVSKKLNQFQSPDSLTQLIIDTIRTYTETVGDIYYYQLFFFRELESLIESLPGLKENTMNPHKTLVEELCRINFNSLYFFHYCKDCVFGLVTMQKEVWDEIFKLKRCLSLSGEVEQKSRLCYNPSKAHITEMLKNWIGDSLYMKESYVKRRLLELEKLNEESSQKMTTTLTVGELALITKLFIEGGVYVSKNKKILSHFMTRNFITIQKDIDEEFSPDHFYNSLSKFNDVTIDTVEAILNRMKARLATIKAKRTGDSKD